MKEKIQYVRLPILLLVLFFIGRLAFGAGLGVRRETYDVANRVFSMVVLQVHIGLLWGAVGRRYRGYGIGGSMTAVVLAVLVSQILIFGATAVSYLAGVDTFFNYPAALNQTEAVSFGLAMASRAGALVVNCIFGAIAGAIGWALGGLLPSEAPRPS